MLKPMQKDAALELCSTLLANISRLKNIHGASQEMKSDRLTFLEFKDKVSFDGDTVTWDEVLAFSRKWLAKYPNYSYK